MDLPLEAKYAHPELLHELGAPCREVTVDLLNLERIGHGGGLEAELALEPIAPRDEPIGQVAPEAGNLGEPGLVNLGGGLDAPGAQHGATRDAHIVETGILDAKLSQIRCALLAFGDDACHGLDARLALEGQRVDALS